MFTFSEPHPGLMGCPKRLPDDIKKVIDGMDGERMSLATAQCRIGVVIPANMRLSLNSNDAKTEGWIGLSEGSIENPPLHSWRLIKYSEEKS